MVIAYFHRTLSFCFFLAVVIAAAGFIAAFAWLVAHGGGLDLLVVTIGIALLAVLAAVTAILMIPTVLADPRAVWIEGGMLHFFENFLNDNFDFVLFVPRKVPLDDIAGLSHVKSEFPGAVERYGVFVDLKSGESHKIATLLLRDRKDVVIAKLSEALGLPKPGREALHALKFPG